MFEICEMCEMCEECEMNCVHVPARHAWSTDFVSLGDIRAVVPDLRRSFTVENDKSGRNTHVDREILNRKRTRLRLFKPEAILRCVAKLRSSPQKAALCFCHSTNISVVYF